MNHGQLYECTLCGHRGRREQFFRTDAVRGQVAEHIAAHHPERWPGTGRICRRCLNSERSDYVQTRLRQERGALSTVEATVAEKAGQHLVIARDIDEQVRRNTSLGQRAADSVARVGGSWAFVSGFMAFLVAWMAVNTMLLRRTAFDPYPYILLNLVLSCLAAIQAPIIMMSQNRQSERDRLESAHDYETDLKAELEIASLHDKMDHLLHTQWERLIELQEMQLELLHEVAGRVRR